MFIHAKETTHAVTQGTNRRHRNLFRGAFALAAGRKLKNAHVLRALRTEKSNAADAGATTRKDQTDLSVTVYNSNLALVRDVREIHLQSGVAPLRFEDVAANIMPATVHFRSLTDPAKLGVLEQNYEYDLLDQNSLLKKFVGRDLLVTHNEVQDNQMKWVLGKGTLISDNNGATVWKIGDEIVTNAQPYSYPGRACRSLQPSDADLDAGQIAAPMCSAWRRRTSPAT